jgi:hypothetical protein
MKTVKDYEYSKKHVIQRLKERHDLNIDGEFYDRMNRKLEPYIGNPDVPSDNNGDQEIHTMFIKIKIVKVVYSKSKKRITTVLPR